MQDELIGASAAIEALRRDIAGAARSDAKVLITGETGSGKEVVARALHRHSLRRTRTLLPVNCAGIPESLLESSLFGHMRGSFTGAVRDHRGLLESAQGGTVLLDEIGETTPRMQGLLLRFMESGEIQRLGDDRACTHVDVRVMAATNKDLRDGVARGQFRLDLFYRLNVIHMRVPPLRERLEDAPVLFEYFLTRYCRQYAIPRPVLSPDAVKVLTDYDWPGNVRELQNAAERLVCGENLQIVDRCRMAQQVTGVKEAPGEPTVVASPANSPAALLNRIELSGESFWSAVHGPFMARDMTREQVIALMRLGLERTGGSYTQLA
jgi:transcriptional regulator with GAF, ATPase, and Fis domain